MSDRIPPPTPKYVLGCMALMTILSLYSRRESLRLETGLEIASFLLTVFVSGLGLAYASWYLGMHKKFPKK